MRSPTFALLLVIYSILFCNIHSRNTLNSDISPSQSQLQIMQASQYHLIQSGSSLQYSLASWQEGTNSKFIQQITIAYSLQILSNSPSYNFIVLYANNEESNSYKQLNCYMRAVNEGFPQFMQNCNFSISPLANGSCSKSIELASETLFSSVSTFFNCSDTSITYNITTPGGVGPINGTMLFILDNSNLFGVNAASNQIKVILSHQVISNVNEEQKTKLYLFSALTCILIVIMIIIAVILKIKIKRLDQEIKTSNQRVKSQ